MESSKLEKDRKLFKLFFKKSMGFSLQQMLFLEVSTLSMCTISYKQIPQKIQITIFIELEEQRESIGQGQYIFNY